MADRIRPVHSSSRSRTRAPTLAIRLIFQFVTPAGFNHEVVISASAGSGSSRPVWESRWHITYRQAHNIDRSGWHPPHLFRKDFANKCLESAQRHNGCPVFARTRPKIPFFCPAADMPWGLIPLWGGWQMGRLPMTIKASGRSALILATGLFVCFAGPSQAGPEADNAAVSSKPESAAGAPIALNKYAKRSARH